MCPLQPTTRTLKPTSAAIDTIAKPQAFLDVVPVQYVHRGTGGLNQAKLSHLLARRDTSAHIGLQRRLYG